jgi:hypothetical protein
MYRIIFRCCDVVNSVHNAPRVFGLDKQTIIKACFFSLYQSLQGYKYTIDIVGDRLSQEMIGFFQMFSDVTIHNYTEELGNHESIRTTLRLALTFNEDDWVFFCEDDYLFTSNAMKIIDTMIQERNPVLRLRTFLRFPNMFIGNLKNKPLLLHPTNQTGYYTPSQRQYSFIFATSNSYWRHIPNVTFTFLIEGKNVQKYYDLLFRTSFGAGDFHLSDALLGKWTFKFRPFLAVAPVPSISAHLHEGLLSPFVHWESIMKTAIEGYTAFISLHSQTEPIVETK